MSQNTLKPSDGNPPADVKKNSPSGLKDASRRPESERTDACLRMQVIRPWVFALAAALLLAGLLIWLFFGVSLTTVTGYAQVMSDGYADCVVSSSRIDEIVEGQKVTVGKVNGTVYKIVPGYVTYDQIADLYGYSVRSLHLDPEDTYYYVRVYVPGAPVGYSSCSIVTRQMTPFQFYFGGD